MSRNTLRSRSEYTRASGFPQPVTTRYCPSAEKNGCGAEKILCKGSSSVSRTRSPLPGKDQRLTALLTSPVANIFPSGLKFKW